MQTGQQLSIVQPLTVVERFSNGDYGVVQRIPNNTVVRYCGPSKMSNMVDLEWHNRLYSAFEQDVAERTQPFGRGASTGSVEGRASKASLHYTGA